MVLWMSRLPMGVALPSGKMISSCTVAHAILSHACSHSSGKDHIFPLGSTDVNHQHVSTQDKGRFWSSTSRGWQEVPCGSFLFVFSDTIFLCKVIQCIRDHLVFSGINSLALWLPLKPSHGPISAQASTLMVMSDASGARTALPGQERSCLVLIGCWCPVLTFQLRKHLFPMSLIWITHIQYHWGKKSFIKDNKL